MKYYAICDVFKGRNGEKEKYEMREYMYTTPKETLWYYAIYDDELKALRECNVLNKGMEAEWKCVVVEIEM